MVSCAGAFDRRTTEGIALSSVTLNPHDILSMTSSPHVASPRVASPRVAGEATCESIGKTEPDDEAQRCLPPSAEEMCNIAFDAESFSIEAAGMQAVQQGLCDTNYRSIYWKLFLGVLEGRPDQWASQIARRRQAFVEIRSKCTANPCDDPDGKGIDLALNNPLSNDHKSPWSQFFLDNELSEMIKLDLMRTHPKNAFFTSDETQRRMLSILFVWSKLNSDLSYRQGMNELLSPLLLVVARDAHRASSFPVVDMRSLFDPQYIEHDTYWLFSTLMDRVVYMFKLEAVSPSSSDAAPPVVARSEFVQNSFLKRVDPDLAAHLQKVDIQPQLYGLRWLRLLLTREFHLEHILVLWDAIFGFEVCGSAALNVPNPNPLVLLDSLAIAMLQFVRNDLMAGDNSACIKRLLSFPPIENMRMVVLRAVEISDPSFLPPAAEDAAPPVELRRRSTPVNLQGAAPVVSHVARSPDPSPAREAFGESISQLFSEVTRVLRPALPSSSSSQPSLNLRLGNHLNSIIGAMQHEIRKGRDECNHEQLLQCLAEIKQIKDVMVGNLPADALEPAMKGPVARVIEAVATDRPAEAARGPLHPLA